MADFPSFYNPELGSVEPPIAGAKTALEANDPHGQMLRVLGAGLARRLQGLIAPAAASTGTGFVAPSAPAPAPAAPATNSEAAAKTAAAAAAPLGTGQGSMVGNTWVGNTLPLFQEQNFLPRSQMAASLTSNVAGVPTSADQYMQDEQKLREMGSPAGARRIDVTPQGQGGLERDNIVSRAGNSYYGFSRPREGGSSPSREGGGGTSLGMMSPINDVFRRLAESAQRYQAMRANGAGTLGGDLGLANTVRLLAQLNPSQMLSGYYGPMAQVAQQHQALLTQQAIPNLQLENEKVKRLQRGNREGADFISATRGGGPAGFYPAQPFSYLTNQYDPNQGFPVPMYGMPQF
jgi:hypothetical protein